MRQFAEYDNITVKVKTDNPDGTSSVATLHNVTWIEQDDLLLQVCSNNTVYHYSPGKSKVLRGAQ